MRTMTEMFKTRVPKLAVGLILLVGGSLVAIVVTLNWQDIENGVGGMLAGGAITIAAVAGMIAGFLLVRRNWRSGDQP